MYYGFSSEHCLIAAWVIKSVRVTLVVIAAHFDSAIILNRDRSIIVWLDTFAFVELGARIETLSSYRGLLNELHKQKDEDDG